MLDLRRRHVFRVAALYVVVAYGMAQAASSFFPALHLPPWSVTLVVALALMGFPIALVLAYALELTPEGVRRTPSEGDEGDGTLTASAPATAAAAVPASVASGPAAATLPGSSPSPPPVAVSVSSPASSPARAAAERAESPAASIAVLPFANLSADAENEYFADGITEELLDALAKVESLRVAARTSSFAFKGKSAAIQEIAAALRVRTVLEGSVRRAGDRVRITAQLIEAEDGFHLWSATYDRRLEDIFAVQEEIARQIAEALRCTLSERESRAIASTPTSIGAYDYYLRGRQYFQRQVRPMMLHARAMFEQAIQIDPCYARAYAGLADTLALYYLWFDRDPAHLATAETAGCRALELDPELAEGRVACGHVQSLTGKYDEAERNLQEAIRLDPTLFEGYYYYGRICLARGKLEQAAELFERANQTRPEDYQSLMLATMVYSGLGQREKERDAAERGLLAAQRHLDLNPDDTRAVYSLATALAHLGRTEEAVAMGDRALAMAPEDSGTTYNVACLHAKLGNVDRALDLLERTVQLGFIHRDWLEHDPDWDALREHERFRAVAEKM